MLKSSFELCKLTRGSSRARQARRAERAGLVVRESSQLPYARLRTCASSLTSWRRFPCNWMQSHMLQEERVKGNVCGRPIDGLLLRPQVRHKRPLSLIRTSVVLSCVMPGIVKPHSRLTCTPLPRHATDFHSLVSRMEGYFEHGAVYNYISSI